MDDLLPRKNRLIASRVCHKSFPLIMFRIYRCTATIRHLAAGGDVMEMRFGRSVIYRVFRVHGVNKC